MEEALIFAICYRELEMMKLSLPMNRDLIEEPEGNYLIFATSQGELSEADFLIMLELIEMENML